MLPQFDFDTDHVREVAHFQKTASDTELKGLFIYLFIEGLQPHQPHRVTSGLN